MSLLYLLFCFVGIATGQWQEELNNDGLFEGDMVLTPEQLSAAREGKLSYSTTKYNHWPTTIYYDFAKERESNPAIMEAIKDYETYTCLRFRRRTTQRAYMYFFNGGGCYSSVGYSGGRVSISIGDWCVRKGTILHEMAHALGIYHEQSRPDRDNYIEIKTENIKDGKAHNFRKQSASKIDSLGTPYDYLSMMHYSGYGFSKNGKPTIVTKDKTMQRRIGQRTGFSEIDKLQINRMYCKKTYDDSFILKHTGGRCLSVNSANEVVFTSSCKTRFTLNDGKLQVKGSSKCLQPSGTYNNAYVSVRDCSADSNFTITKQNLLSGIFALQHIKTGKCFHPYGGSGRPSENTRVVIYSSCDQWRLKFKKVM